MRKSQHGFSVEERSSDGRIHFLITRWENYKRRNSKGELMLGEEWLTCRNFVSDTLRKLSKYRNRFSSWHYDTDMTAAFTGNKIYSNEGAHILLEDWNEEFSLLTAPWMSKSIFGGKARSYDKPRGLFYHKRKWNVGGTWFKRKYFDNKWTGSIYYEQKIQERISWYYKNTDETKTSNPKLLKAFLTQCHERSENYVETCNKNLLWGAA